MAENTGGLDPIVKTIQLVAVVVGVVISVLSFNATRQQETVARELELAKPFLVRGATTAMSIPGKIINNFWCY